VFALMLVLALAGIALFIAAPVVARLLVRGADPVGATRIIQVVAVVLLIGALFLRPHSDETAAFPPPPDTPARDAPR
jgi:hypothetical protein